jgi:glucokinase
LKDLEERVDNRGQAVREKRLLCGVDLGGTKLSAGLVRPDGSLVDKLVAYDHAEKDERCLCGRIGEMVRELLDRQGIDNGAIRGVGIGFAGHLRFAEGVVITTSNFPRFKMKDLPIRRMVQEQLGGVPVIVDNDANAQGYAEFLFGAGAGYDTMIFLTVSTGIGAGLVLNRRIFRGLTGTAGEFGHTIVNPESDIRCGCGNYGCLMSHASGLALPQVVRKKLEQGAKTGLAIDDSTRITGELIKQGLDAGDPLCRSVVLEYADYIGIGIYNLFQIFNPPVVVLGGGLMSWGPVYFERIKEKFHSLAGDMLYDPMEIALARTGRDAGLIGAAALLLEEQ